MHFDALLRHIQAYSALYVTSYSQSGHILSPGNFRMGGVFKTLLNFEQTYSEPWHSQKSLFRHCSAMFRHIENV